MENLSIFNKEILEILRQFEYYCEKSSSISVNEKGEKHVKILKVDYSVMKDHTHFDILQTSKYLRKNGVNFYVNESGPFLEIRPGFDINVGCEGIIKGESVEEITAKVKELIHKLTSKTKEEVIIINYNTKIGVFTFNGEKIKPFEGIQRVVSTSLVVAGCNTKVSWDEINEKNLGAGEAISSDPGNNERTLIKKRINGAVSEINKKTEKYLKNELLIGLKDNEYWLQYEVKIDG